MNNPKIEYDAADVGDAALTTEQLLYVIGYGKDPTKIAHAVQRFLQQNPLSGHAMATIANAVYERNKLERQKGNNHAGAKRMRLDGSPGVLMREPPWLQLEISTTSNAKKNKQQQQPTVERRKNRPNSPITSSNPNPSSSKCSNPSSSSKWLSINTPYPFVGMLKRICLSRQSLERIERVCCVAEPFGRLRNVLLGCLVCVEVQGENLVAQIRDVEHHMRIGKNVHLKRRLFLPPIGYFEFNQVSDHSPTEEEMQLWIQQRRMPLPDRSFLSHKIVQLNQISGAQISANQHAELNGSTTTAQSSEEGTSAGPSRQAEQNSADDGDNDENVDVSEIVHSQETLIQSLLPSEQFLGILRVCNKFAERAKASIGCLVAYRILGDPVNRVYISEIAKIDTHSVHFKYKPAAVEFAKLLPVVEERDVDEDVYGTWLEEMDNWQEPLPILQTLMTAKTNAMDTISQTLQTAPPLDSSAGYTHRDLLVRPEKIAQLLSGLDREEFGHVISGMFVTFDFTGHKYSVVATSARRRRRTRMDSSNRFQFLPISAVTFDGPMSSPVPFLPANNRTSNALLHIDPRVKLFEWGSNRMVTTLPIPQTERLLSQQRFVTCCSVLRTTNYEFPSVDFVEHKVKRLWLALEKAKANTTGGVRTKQEESTNTNGNDGCVPMEIEEE